MLRKAQTDWPKGGKPVEFDLEVVENTAPTPDQVTLIMSYLPSRPVNVASAFMSAHPASTGVGVGVGAAPNQSQGLSGITAGTEATIGGNAEHHPDVVSKTLSELMRTNPNALKWPIVVDWMGGRASVGDLDGVRVILDAIRKEQGASADSDA